jgi:hypothetical protein
MKIIGISGKAQNGKDESARILKTNLEHNGKKILLIHYADYLKYIAKTYYGWNEVKDEKGRTLLQNIGEIARKKDVDYWVKTVYNFIDIFGSDFDYIIIPDCRHFNEYQYLISKGLDVTSLRINRIGFVNSLTQEQKNHISETALDNYEFDIVLNVKEGIEELIKAIDDLSEKL